MSSVTHEYILQQEVNYWRIEAQTDHDRWLRVLEELEKYRWQPIATAPKNGTWILISLYYNNYPNEKQTAITFWMDDINGWVWFGNNYKEKITLTHWMPLPKPPTQ